MLLNQMDSAIKFLYEQDSYLYDFLQELKSDKVDSSLFDSYLLSAPSFIELSQKVDTFDLTNYLTKDEANGFATKTELVDYATKTELNNYATVVDHGATKFTLTNTETFTMLHQHIYQIGALIFIHLVFRTNAKVEEPGLFTLGKLDDSILPQHVHSFTVVPANPGVNDDMRVDPGYIALDGSISFDVTKSYSTKNYTFDITTFYCTDITSAITTE